VLRRWRQTVAPQDIANRLIGYLVSQIGQRPHNPVIAPVPVLPGHPNDQLLDFSLDARSARAATRRAIELADDQLAMPAQDGVRSGYGGDVGKNPAAQAMADLAEHLSLGIRKPQPTSSPLKRLEPRNGWLGRQDSNLGMEESKSSALPLGYAPAGGRNI
jgi:hypothetical protein